jgi:hypothetical protein
MDGIYYQKKFNQRKRQIAKEQLVITWKAGGNTTLPPSAHASLSKDCSYSAGGDSVSDELELAEG